MGQKVIQLQMSTAMVEKISSYTMSLTYLRKVKVSQPTCKLFLSEDGAPVRGSLYKVVFLPPKCFFIQSYLYNWCIGTYNSENSKGEFYFWSNPPPRLSGILNVWELSEWNFIIGETNLFLKPPADGSAVLISWWAQEVMGFKDHAKLLSLLVLCYIKFK
jgi:hypothetical protein